MLKPSNLVKLRIGVPATHAEAVRKALGKAGAGRMGNYDYCSFTYPGMGRYRPLKGAKPAIGRVGKLETVKEVAIETICPKKLVKKALSAVIKAHPYEHPAIDITPLLEVN